MTEQNQDQLNALIDRWAGVPVSPYYGFGRVKLHGPKGMQVEIPLAGDPVTFWSQCEKLLAQGWTVTAPGLEEGEQKETYRWVARVQVESRSGLCSRVFLYVDNDGFTKKHLAEYLNTDDAVAAFEHGTRMKLDSIPVTPGKIAPERGTREGNQYIVEAPKPFGAVWKLNPEYHEGDKDKTKRLLVRWENQRPPTKQPKPEPTPQTLSEKEAEALKEWAEELNGIQPEDATAFNACLSSYARLSDGPFRATVKKLLNECVQRCGFKLDPKAKIYYVAPVPLLSPTNKTTCRPSKGEK